jgi:hypothetical protein
MAPRASSLVTKSKVNRRISARAGNSPPSESALVVPSELRPEVPTPHNRRRVRWLRERDANARGTFA